MKKAYKAPKLTIHGRVEEITQAFGSQAVNDTFTYNGKTFPGDGGSTNGIVVPVK